MKKINFFSDRLIFRLCCLFVISWLTSACNYYYYQGKKLEAEGRFEEANIEYQRAYIDDPEDEDYKAAFQRTAQKTVGDLLKRYERYLKERKYNLAFKRLERARVLSPNNEKIISEQNKWYRVLLAGKIDMKFISLKDELPLFDEMFLAVRLNSPNQDRPLIAYADYKTGVFFVEDVLYDPPQDLLMFYSLSSIGVKMTKYSRGQGQFRTEEFYNFVNFRTPVLTKITGKLDESRNTLEKSGNIYPFETLKKDYQEGAFVPPRSIRYALKLNKDRVSVNSSNERIDFVPQLLYLNKKDKRVFIDFGHLFVEQNKLDGPWAMKRYIDPNRAYYDDLEENVILNPYFYTREGGYPFVFDSDIEI